MTDQATNKVAELKVGVSTSSAYSRDKRRVPPHKHRHEAVVHYSNDVASANKVFKGKWRSVKPRLRAWIHDAEHNLVCEMDVRLVTPIREITLNCEIATNCEVSFDYEGYENANNPKSDS